MSEFFKSTCGDCKLIIDYKIKQLKKQLEELQTILLNSEDDYAREYTVVFNMLLSLENIRLYKMVTKNKS